MASGPGAGPNAMCVNCDYPSNAGNFACKSNTGMQANCNLSQFANLSICGGSCPDNNTPTPTPSNNSPPPSNETPTPVPTDVAPASTVTPTPEPTPTDYSPEPSATDSSPATATDNSPAPTSTNSDYNDDSGDYSVSDDYSQ